MRPQLQFGIPLTAEGRSTMQRHMDDRLRATHSKHLYDTGSSEQIATERLLFKRYSEYFNMPDDV